MLGLLLDCSGRISGMLTGALCWIPLDAGLLMPKLSLGPLGPLIFMLGSEEAMFIFCI